MTMPSLIDIAKEIEEEENFEKISEYIDTMYGKDVNLIGEETLLHLRESAIAFMIKTGLKATEIQLVMLPDDFTGRYRFKWVKIGK